MIDLDQILYADRFAFLQRGKDKRLDSLLSAIKSLFFTTFKFPSNRSAEFIFFRSLVRDDYKNLMHEVASTVPTEKSIIIEDYLRNRSKPAPMAFILALRLLPAITKIQATDIYERIFLYLRLCFYYRILRSLSKFEFNTIVFFADMQPVECLLAQHFRHTGKRTVTLQHGLYVDYGDLPTVNVINYRHQPSEYFLAWGQNTADLIQRSGINRKVFICGKPSIALSATHRDTAAPHDTHPKHYFTVILDQNIFQEHNIKMIMLLDEYARDRNLTMNVRYHPGNKRATYEQLGADYCTNLQIESSQFVVGHTSSLLYEVMLLGIPVVKFKTEVPCIAIPSDLTFESKPELEYALSKASSYNFSKLSTDYIAYFGSESLNKYEEFFSRLNSDTNPCY
ncbi:hypothetical protein ACF8C6_13315 [Pseudomonas sp. zbq_18]|uniref:hypothetical protein n=1 Tax=Pseudomonadota TaxID=1224 RepID=UPI00370BC31D